MKYCDRWMMAERGDSFDDDSSYVRSIEPETRRARKDSLRKAREERSTKSYRRSGSHSPVPAWRRAVELKAPSPPPPPSPHPFSVTAWFSSFFKLQKVVPETGVRRSMQSATRITCQFCTTSNMTYAGLRNLDCQNSQ